MRVCGIDSSKNHQAFGSGLTIINSNSDYAFEKALQALNLFSSKSRSFLVNDGLKNDCIVLSIARGGEKVEQKLFEDLSKEGIAFIHLPKFMTCKKYNSGGKHVINSLIDNLLKLGWKKNSIEQTKPSIIDKKVGPGGGCGKHLVI